MSKDLKQNNNSELIEQLNKYIKNYPQEGRPINKNKNEFYLLIKTRDLDFIERAQGQNYLLLKFSKENKEAVIKTYEIYSFIYQKFVDMYVKNNFDYPKGIKKIEAPNYESEQQITQYLTTKNKEFMKNKITLAELKTRIDALSTNQDFKLHNTPTDNLNYIEKYGNKYLFNQTELTENVGLEVLNEADALLKEIEKKKEIFDKISYLLNNYPKTTINHKHFASFTKKTNEFITTIEAPDFSIEGDKITYTGTFFNGRKKQQDLPITSLEDLNLATLKTSIEDIYKQLLEEVNKVPEANLRPNDHKITKELVKEELKKFTNDTNNKDEIYNLLGIDSLKDEKHKDRKSLFPFFSPLYRDGEITTDKDPKLSNALNKLVALSEYFTKIVLPTITDPADQGDKRAKWDNSLKTEWENYITLQELAKKDPENESLKIALKNSPLHNDEDTHNNSINGYGPIKEAIDSDFKNNQNLNIQLGANCVAVLDEKRQEEVKNIINSRNKKDDTKEAAIKNLATKYLKVCDSDLELKNDGSEAVIAHNKEGDVLYHSKSLGFLGSEGDGKKDAFNDQYKFVQNSTIDLLTAESLKRRNIDGLVSTITSLQKDIVQKELVTIYNPMTSVGFFVSQTHELVSTRNVGFFNTNMASAELDDDAYKNIQEEDLNKIITDLQIKLIKQELITLKLPELVEDDKKVEELLKNAIENYNLALIKYPKSTFLASAKAVVKTESDFRKKLLNEVIALQKEVAATLGDKNKAWTYLSNDYHWIDKDGAIKKGRTAAYSETVNMENFPLDAIDVEILTKGKEKNKSIYALRKEIFESMLDDGDLASLSEETKTSLFERFNNGYKSPNNEFVNHFKGHVTTKCNEIFEALKNTFTNDDDKKIIEKLLTSKKQEEASKNLLKYFNPNYKGDLIKNSLENLSDNILIQFAITKLVLNSQKEITANNLEQLTLGTIATEAGREMGNRSNTLISIGFLNNNTTREGLINYINNPTTEYPPLKKIVSEELLEKLKKDNQEKTEVKDFVNQLKEFVNTYPDNTSIDANNSVKYLENSNTLLNSLKSLIETEEKKAAGSGAKVIQTIAKQYGDDWGKSIIDRALFLNEPATEGVRQAYNQIDGNSEENNILYTPYNTDLILKLIEGQLKLVMEAQKLTVLFSNKDESYNIESFWVKVGELKNVVTEPLKEDIKDSSSTEDKLTAEEVEILDALYKNLQFIKPTNKATLTDNKALSALVAKVQAYASEESIASKADKALLKKLKEVLKAVHQDKNKDNKDKVPEWIEYLEVAELDKVVTRGALLDNSEPEKNKAITDLYDQKQEEFSNKKEVEKNKEKDDQEQKIKNAPLSAEELYNSTRLYQNLRPLIKGQDLEFYKNLNEGCKKMIKSVRNNDGISPFNVFQDILAFGAPTALAVTAFAQIAPMLMGTVPVAVPLLLFALIVLEYLALDKMEDLGFFPSIKDNSSTTDATTTLIKGMTSDKKKEFIEKSVDELKNNLKTEIGALDLSSEKGLKEVAANINLLSELATKFPSDDSIDQGKKEEFNNLNEARKNMLEEQIKALKDKVSDNLAKELLSAKSEMNKEGEEQGLFKAKLGVISKYALAGIGDDLLKQEIAKDETLKVKDNLVDTLLAAKKALSNNQPAVNQPKTSIKPITCEELTSKVMETYVNKNNQGSMVLS